MTVVGKILVFLTLVFSLVVGALAVLDYSTRTQWAAGYKKLEANYQTALESNRVEKAEREKLAKEREDLNNRLTQVVGKFAELRRPEDPARLAQYMTKALEDYQEKDRNQKRRIDDLTKDLETEKRKLGQSETGKVVAVNDVGRRQSEVEKIRATLKAETAKNYILVAEKNDLVDKRVAAEILAETYKERAEGLEKELGQTLKDMERMRTRTAVAAAGPGAARGLNPPPENVEGFIRSKDAKGELVSLTLGSDAGLAKDHTMEVFRLGDRPRYVGRVKIVSVSHKSSVAEFLGRPATPVQVGDRVASSIMPGNK
jgi:hypothetical protein